MQLASGEHARCFVIITRQAQDAGGEVHDRMPAFLTPGAVDEWLEPAKLDRGGREGMLTLLDAASAEVAATVTQYIVDRKVNSTRTVDPSDPTVIEPAA
jgi:putative SOS response-associated peptidase YedK